MNFLFKDMADQGAEKKKKPKAAEDELPEDPLQMKSAKSADPFAGLGQSAGEFECFNCSADVFEIMIEDRGSWQLWCVFCGCRQWEQAKQRDVFVFRSGRFSGMTLAQISSREGGDAYIAFMSKKADSRKVREACQAWLDRPGVPE